MCWVEYIECVESHLLLSPLFLSVSHFHPHTERIFRLLKMFHHFRVCAHQIRLRFGSVQVCVSETHFTITVELGYLCSREKNDHNLHFTFSVCVEIRRNGII